MNTYNPDYSDIGSIEALKNSLLREAKYSESLEYINKC